MGQRISARIRIIAYLVVMAVMPLNVAITIVRMIAKLCARTAMNLSEGITAIITGGASGLGEGTARVLAASGVKVGIFDLNVERGERLANAIRARLSPMMWLILRALFKLI